MTIIKIQDRNEIPFYHFEILDHKSRSLHLIEDGHDGRPISRREVIKWK